MNQVHLNVKTRETGKQISKQYRRDGLVPGVFYTKGEDSIPILAEPLDLRPIVYTAQTRIVDLQIDDATETKECVIKDVILDPVTESITHFDLLGVIRGQKLSVEVPFVLKGQAIGAREGGVTQHILLKTVIRCLPKDLPNSIEVEIDDLQIGDSIMIKDLDPKSIENLEFEVPLDSTIVAIIRPRVSSDAEGEEGEGEGEEGVEGGEESAESNE